MSHAQYPLCRPSDGPFDTSSSADLYMIRSAEAVRLCVPDTQLICIVSELSCYLDQTVSPADLLYLVSRKPISTRVGYF